MQATLRQAPGPLSAADSTRRAAWIREVYRAGKPADAPTFVLISQVYVPDPAAVGQYMHQAAAALAERGLRVIVFTADRGYEDPAQAYLQYELRDGVQIVRLPWSSFGKNNLRNRLVGGGIFTAEATLLAAALPRIDHVLISTSPPMVGAAGVALARTRKTKLSVWVMDINPDQIVASGRMSESALPVRALDWLNRQTLRHAKHVVTLDSVMAERLHHNCPGIAHVEVLPPWPLFSVDALDPQAGTSFRRTHGLQDKRVVMYSGNLSPLHPIDTLLHAARALRGDPRLVFVFVGGGAARPALERYVIEHRLANVLMLPYQPLSTLHDSLSAADLHLVSMGEDMVGVVHPSKIYSTMAVGRPVLALGPARSHIAVLVKTHQLGWHIEHGDVTGAIAALEQFAAADQAHLITLGARAHAAIAEHFDPSRLVDRFCRIVQQPREHGTG